MKEVIELVFYYYCIVKRLNLPSFLRTPSKMNSPPKKTRSLTLITTKKGNLGMKDPLQPS